MNITNTPKHIAIHGPELSMNSPFIQNILKGESADYFPELVGKKGVLFSNMTLRKFIDEEFLHDQFKLTQGMNRSIRTLSSGEQKKALLQYLLLDNPEFLLVDNPFDALDVESVQTLKEQLCDLALKMPIIQLFKRREDLLPFIDMGIRLDGEKVIFAGPINAYLERYNAAPIFQFRGSIPPAHQSYKLNSDELIRFSKVCVNYDDRAILNNITWTIKRGEFWQLKGPNGSGKTTLLTMITGDNPKAYGEDIYLFGKRKGSGESIWQIKKMIGYFTPAMMDLFKRRNTAIQMIVSGLTDSIGLYKKVPDSSLYLAEEWLHFLGMSDKANTPFLQLNQVQRRLIMIARAMIKHPPLLILDEPSNGLDDQGAEMLSFMINKMANESRTTIIYVSHRDEPGLKPHFIFQLSSSESGSRGKLIHAKYDE